MNPLPCPGCEARYDVSRFEPGKKLRCKVCRTVLVVPAAAPAEEAPPAAPLDATTRLRRTEGIRRRNPTTQLMKPEELKARLEDRQSQKKPKKKR